MSWAIWITGIPGSGKSARAQAAANLLRARGHPVTVIELDALLGVLTPRPAHSKTERDAMYRSLVYVATVLTESRMPVIIDATAHRRDWRQLARASIRRFAEVELVCPLEVSRAREQARAVRKRPLPTDAPAELPSVDVAYQLALAPDVIVDTAQEDVDTTARRIFSLVSRFAETDAPRPTPSAPGWAIWLTGPAGSGKTTLARTVARHLGARGHPVTVLEIARLREDFLGEVAVSETATDLGHRAMVYAAARLVEAGSRVIIDAAASRRAWRDLARARIPHFAEVELVCPTDTCGERERAARWQLGPGKSAGSRGRPGAPDLETGYERALNPELTIRTDSRSVPSAADDIVHLALRLERAASAPRPNFTEEMRRPEG